jgi:hypothetical protein
LFSGAVCYNESQRFRIGDMAEFEKRLPKPMLNKITKDEDKSNH